jgi:inositol transport system substrate-binding protein
MKNFLAAAMLLGTTAIPAFAEDMNVGVVLVAFDNQFQSLIKTAIEEAGAGVEGLSLQFEDGMGDVAKQNDQVSNLIASGVDAIIVSPIDAQGTAPMTAAATAAGIPLIFVNNRPVGDLPDGTAFVGSNETEAGTLEMQEVCRLMGGKGDLLIIMGGLEYEQTRLRTGANEAVLATPECSGIKVADKQAGNWSRDSGANLMTNWLSGGIQPRGVVANNDDMALGAIQSLKAAGFTVGTGKSDVIVGGIDAIVEARQSVANGEMAATVFQDAVGQGKGALDAALKMAKGEQVEKEIFIPFQLVNKDNVSNF